jgi:hypothetical protein
MIFAVGLTISLKVQDVSGFDMGRALLASRAR